MNTLIAFVLLLGLLIFVHELGHFLVAKACGVRVLTFSLGFGPRLVGITIGDTDYRLSLLPLGGYVRMYGDDVYTEVPDDQKQYAFLQKPFWQKSAIAAAGPVANFLLPIAVLTVVFYGSETLLAARVGTVVPEGPADRAGLQPGDTIVSLDDTPVHSFADLQNHIEARPGREVAVTVRRGDETVDLTVIPRSVRSDDPVEPDKTLGRIGVMPYHRAPVVDVAEHSAAWAAGLRAGTRVLAVNGQKVNRQEELLAALDAADPAAPWHLTVRKVLPDQSLEDETEVVVPVQTDFNVQVVSEVARYAVMRDEIDGDIAVLLDKAQAHQDVVADRLIARRGLGPYEGRVESVAEGTAAEHIGLGKRDRLLWVDGHALTYAGEAAGRLAEDPRGIHVMLFLDGANVRAAIFRMGPRKEWGLESIRTFGASVDSRVEGGERITRPVSLQGAVGRAVSATGMLVDKTWRGLKMLFTLQVSPKSLGGPLTIARVAGNAMEQGWDRFIEVLCFISVNLGLINLLPIPVLDGGHLLIFIIEAVQRKKLSIKQKERAFKFGFAVLACVMVFAFYNDIMRELLS